MNIAPAPESIAASLAELVVPIESLTLHPRNARKGDLAAIADSLRRFGQLKPAVVQASTRKVVAGNHMVKAATALGWRNVAASIVELSDREAEGFLLADNRTSDLGEYDEALLAQLLSEAAAAENLLGTGYSAGDVDEILAATAAAGRTDPDDVPELAQEPYVERGQLWQLGRHRLLCGDATDPADVARLLEGAQPRLLATDPPYGVSLDPTWRDGVYNKLGRAEQPYMADEAGEGRATPHPRSQGHRNTTLSGDTRVDWSDAFALVPSIHVGYVWHAGVHAADVAAGLLRIGFEIASQVIWDKGHFAMSRGWLHWAHEPCWLVRKKGIPNLFLGEHDLGTVWRAPSPKMIMAGSAEEKFDHPAQKPVVLFENAIRHHAGAVYDPFLGSGTSLIAAERLSRQLFGLELEPRYAQLVIERWQAFTGERAVAL